MLHRSTPVLIVLATMAATPAIAGHANPWATPDTVLLERFHDENQAASIGTPGEDEMRGAMVQTARGKLDPSPSANRGDGGRGAGEGRGSGGHGNGRNGN